MVRLGQPVNRVGDLPKRVGVEGADVLAQRKLLQRFPNWIMHAFIFWGFLVLLTTIVEAIGQIVDRSFKLPWIGDTAALNLIQDTFAALVLVGVGIAFYIRKVERPDRFKGSHLREADYILLWLVGIILTLFGVKSTAIALSGGTANSQWAYISNGISHIWTGLGANTLDTLTHPSLSPHLPLIPPLP